jgi:RNA polymerase sigma factor (sigma-70 family)
MDLLERFAHGDLEAFETMFSEYQAVVYAWILRIVRNSSVAEDLTVETFWRIYCAHARFDPARPFEGWARRVSTNVALQYLKRTRSDLSLADNSLSIEVKDPVDQAQIAAGIRRAFLFLIPPVLLRITTICRI